MTENVNVRKPIIAGNWKMNKTGKETVALINTLKELVVGVENVDIVVAPPFTEIRIVTELVKNTNIQVGAQNMYFESSGAYTGEISPLMIKDSGCRWVIIGHSERRQYFGCSDELVIKKLKTAVREKLIPIVCIGETLQERESNKTYDILKVQLSQGLKNLSLPEQEVLTIAYEPVWAIGTGKTATPLQAEEVHSFIRTTLCDMFGKEISQSTRILYGGSVKSENVKELMAKDNIDGALVGGASLEAESFAGIVRGCL